MDNGRWPANVILSPGSAEVLDAQTGILKSGTKKSSGVRRDDESGWRFRSGAREGDEGGASRFFLRAGYEPWELEWILANGLTPCGMEEEQ